MAQFPIIRLSSFSNYAKFRVSSQIDLHRVTNSLVHLLNRKTCMRWILNTLEKANSSASCIGRDVKSTTPTDGNSILLSLFFSQFFSTRTGRLNYRLAQ